MKLRINRPAFSFIVPLQGPRVKGRIGKKTGVRQKVFGIPCDGRPAVPAQGVAIEKSHGHDYHQFEAAQEKIVRIHFPHFSSL